MSPSSPAPFAAPPETASSGLQGFDFALALVLLITVAFGLPYLDPRVLPIHDSLYCFQSFQIFYSEYFFAGDLVHWYPYGTFGIPADLQQVIALTPIDYAAGLIGQQLGVTNALLLFKLATIGEHLVYVLGIYLLARELFPSRTTALALGVAAAGSVVWYAQLWFELRNFYGLPFVLLWFVRFLETQRPGWLFLSGICAVAWTLGNVPYFVSVWTLVLVLLAAATALARRRAWRALLSPSIGELLVLLAFAGVAATYLYFAFHSLDNLLMREPGRDLMSGEVDLETFRSWGGNADMASVARSFLFGWPVHLPWGSGEDNSAYIGLLPLLGVALAMVRSRDPLLLGLLAATGVLIAMSLGGVVTSLLYHLPTFAQYRHVGLVYGLVKTLLIIAGGFGLERLWRWPSAERAGRRRGVVWVVFAAGLALLVAYFGSVWQSVGEPPWSLAALLRLGTYAALGAGSLLLGRSPSNGLVLALVLDVASYQAAVHRELPRLPDERGAELAAFEVTPISYQPIRLAAPVPEPDAASPVRNRQQIALDVVEHPRTRELYWITYTFADFDPCKSAFWTDIWTPGVANLLDIASNQAVPIDWQIGCNTPKMRIVDSIEVAHSVGEAAKLLIERVPRDVIRPPPDAQLEGTSSTAPSRPAGSVQVEQFSANELVARVRVDAAEGWLIYADSFHPGWRASVNGKRVAVFEANLGFKAVWVPAGESVVRLWFLRGMSGVASVAIATFGVLVTSGIVAIAALALLGRLPLRFG